MPRKFVPKPGQVDYTNIRWAPVLTCIVMYKEKILLVKRSRELSVYPGFWSVIGGFLDDNKSLEEKVMEELSEELALKPGDIRSIRPGPIFDLDDPLNKKTWVTHTVLAEVGTDQIALDWEAEESKWVMPAEAKKQQNLTENTKRSLELFFPS